MSDKNLKILLVQLVSLGDCLYATAIARQIKNDYPACHLTWAIGSCCAPLLMNNPYVDELLKVEITSITELERVWNHFSKRIKSFRHNKTYDHIFISQLNPGNFRYFDGTIRQSMYRAFGRPITVPDSPVVILDELEKSRVKSFITLHKIDSVQTVILFEWSAKSDQSFVDRKYAINFSKMLVELFDDLIVLMSSLEPCGANHARIIDVNHLTFRENLYLSNYCNLMIGCSSGISWLLTSTEAKRIPTIQLLKKETSVYASMVHDFESRGQDSSWVLEMTDSPPDHLFGCVKMYMKEGFQRSRERYHESLKIDFIFYGGFFFRMLKRGQIFDAVFSAFCTLKRYHLYTVFVMSLLLAACQYIKRMLLRCNPLSNSSRFCF